MKFELLLTLFVLTTGIIYCSKSYLQKKLASKTSSSPMWHNTHQLTEFTASLFPVLLLVLLLRSFLIEPFLIPSGSLEPTLHVGDFIVVNKYQYGLHLPVNHQLLLPVKQPKRGDIVVFQNPEDKNKEYLIKRVIGLPGDKIDYIDKQLYINHQVMKQNFIRDHYDYDFFNRIIPVTEKLERLFNCEHQIFLQPQQPARNFYQFVVPKGHYFVMGDNRDNSRDSRYFGTIRDNQLIGKAILIWFSWDKHATNWLHKIRYSRIGQFIHH